MGGFAQAQAAHAELAVYAVNASALPATVLPTGGELGRSVCFDDQSLACHVIN